MEDFARVLIVETSSKTGQVAAAEAGRVTGVRLLPEARRHARDLAARTAELLAERSWKARDLTAIVAGIGPGSFTGLRVAAASAKALAYAAGAALFGVPAFDAIARGIAQGPPALEVIADAQQGQVYCQRFVRDPSGDWRPNESISIRPFDLWVNGLLPGSLVAGPAVAIYRGRLPEHACLAGEEAREARAETLLAAVLASPEQYRSSPWSLEPIYLRGSSAEEKRLKG